MPWLAGPEKACLSYLFQMFIIEQSFIILASAVLDLSGFS